MGQFLLQETMDRGCITDPESKNEAGEQKKFEHRWFFWSVEMEESDKSEKKRLGDIFKWVQLNYE